MSVLSKLIYLIQSNPSQNPNIFGDRGKDLNKLLQKCIWKCKGLRKASKNVFALPDMEDYSLSYNTDCKKIVL